MQRSDRQRFWRCYKDNVKQGRQPSLRDLGFSLGEIDERVGLARVISDSVEEQDRESALITEKNSDIDDAKKDENRGVQLCLDFLEAVDHGDEALFNQMLQLKIPINFQHPLELETAMHISCSRNRSNAMTERLLLQPDVDLLLRDQFGRQAWNNAEFFGIERDLTEKVRTVTEEQAKNTIGLEAFYQEHQRHLGKWLAQSWYTDLTRFVDYD